MKMESKPNRRPVAVLAAFGAASFLLIASSNVAMTEEIHSVKVALPSDAAEFQGPGAGAVNQVCLACHSAEMVLTQPRLSAAAWTAEVGKMRKVFKAPIDDADAAAIVDYLVKLQSSQ